MPGTQSSTKHCPKCGETKPLSGGFSRNRSTPDGMQCRCKACNSLDNASWCRADPVRNAARIARWRAQNPRKAKAIARRAHKKFPFKVAARAAVCRATKTGRLVRGPCKICGLKPKKVKGHDRIQGHHHKGWGREYWLDVVWLCVPHHAKAEARTRETPVAAEPKPLS